MLLFVLALCMAGCTAQTRIERVQMPATLAETNLPEREEEAYPDAQSISSPTRTISGTLSLYSQKIILIAGGYDKKIPYDAMGPVVNEKVKLLILMGNTADKIQSAVTKAENYDPQVIRIIRVENMEEAVETAHRLAQKGDVVSLSPASASFDLYPNFAARGNHFKQLVNAL